MTRSSVVLTALLAVLLHGLPRASADKPTEPLQYTEKFLFSKISYNMMHLADNLKAATAGQLKHLPETPRQKVNVSCLNSVAPAPLNWQMWCPDTHATVTQWVDHVGSTHRKIELVPMPTMTAEMAVFFMTPMFPKTMNVSGKVFPKNLLWHPLDHKPKQDFKLGPGKMLLDPPQLMSKLDEKYRAPAGTPDRGFKTELWVAAMDLAVNLPRSRYVLGFDVLGFQAFTLIVEFNDSPKGLVVSVEVIIGAAAKGYDPKNPTKGVAAAMAKAANTMLLQAVMKPYHENGDFDGALDAVTRHVVEEFGNLPNFVPIAWQQHPQGKLAAELSTFKKNIITLIRPEGSNSSENSTSSEMEVSAYPALAALSAIAKGNFSHKVLPKPSN